MSIETRIIKGIPTLVDIGDGKVRTKKSKPETVGINFRKTASKESGIDPNNLSKTLKDRRTRITELAKKRGEKLNKK
jgi:hypothetical protein